MARPTAITSTSVISLRRIKPVTCSISDQLCHPLDCGRAAATAARPHVSWSGRFCLAPLGEDPVLHPLGLGGARLHRTEQVEEPPLAGDPERTRREGDEGVALLAAPDGETDQLH